MKMKKTIQKPHLAALLHRRNLKTGVTMHILLGILRSITVVQSLI